MYNAFICSVYSVCRDMFLDTNKRIIIIVIIIIIIVAVIIAAAAVGVLQATMTASRCRRPGRSRSYRDSCAPPATRVTGRYSRARWPASSPSTTPPCE